jgi:hypothetical protein
MHKFVEFIEKSTNRPVAINPWLVRAVRAPEPGVAEIIFDEAHMIAVSADASVVIKQLAKARKVW